MTSHERNGPAARPRGAAGLRRRYAVAKSLAQVAEYESPLLLIAQTDKGELRRVTMRIVPAYSVPHHHRGVLYTAFALLMAEMIYPRRPFPELQGPAERSSLWDLAVTGVVWTVPTALVLWLIFLAPRIQTHLNTLLGLLQGFEAISKRLAPGRADRWQPEMPAATLAVAFVLLAAGGLGWWAAWHGMTPIPPRLHWLLVPVGVGALLWLLSRHRTTLSKRWRGVWAMRLPLVAAVVGAIWWIAWYETGPMPWQAHGLFAGAVGGILLWFLFQPHGGLTGWRRAVRRGTWPSLLCYALLGAAVWLLAEYVWHVRAEPERWLMFFAAVAIAVVGPPYLVYQGIKLSTYDAVAAPGTALDPRRPSVMDLERLLRTSHERVETNREYKWHLVRQIVAPTRARTSIATLPGQRGTREILTRLLILKDLFDDDKSIRRIQLILYPVSGGLLILLAARLSGWFSTTAIIAAALVWVLLSVGYMLGLARNYPKRLQIEYEDLRALPAFLAPPVLLVLDGYSEGRVAQVIARELRGSISVVIAIMLIGFFTMLSPSNWDSSKGGTPKSSFFHATPDRQDRP